MPINPHRRKQPGPITRQPLPDAPPPARGHNLNNTETILNDIKAILNNRETILNDREAILNDTEAILNNKEAILNDKETILNDKEVIPKNEAGVIAVKANNTGCAGALQQEVFRKVCHL